MCGFSCQDAGGTCSTLTLFKLVDECPTIETTAVPSTSLDNNGNTSTLDNVIVVVAPETSSPTSNLPLIMGLAIPLCLTTCAFIVLVVWLLRKKSTNDNHHHNQHPAVSTHTDMSATEPTSSSFEASNQYDNLASISPVTSHYKDWQDAENPTPKHYDQVDSVRRPLEAGYVDINDIASL
jgi:cytoskeletal protein RodZ